MIKHDTPSSARSSGLLVHAVAVTCCIIIIIILQAVASLIFGPTIPNAAAAVPDFNVATVGDWGCKTATTSTVNNIVDKNSEITIGLGDNSYADTADCWFQKIAPIHNQMYTAIGNHDDLTSAMLAQYMNHFNMQEQYFSFNYQNAHFLVISNEVASSVGSAQYFFVQDDLQNAACNPDIKWIIVAYHKNAYTSPNSLVSPSTSFRDIYHPIFEEYGVDLVLQGHVHAYERSYPLKHNVDNPSSPIRDTSSTNNYNDPDGQIFATIGTGGQNFHSYSGQDPAFVTQIQNLFGFLNIDILNDGNSLRGTFFGNDGTTRDQFTIQKSSSNVCYANPRYDYEPSLVLDGTNYVDVPSSSSLQLGTFSVAAWFKTTADYSANTFIVNKGGIGSESTGKNMNYGIWMTSSERIRAGFETSTGVDYFTTSSAGYNDGRWHYVVATYDGSSTVRLYIDGKAVVSTSTSGALPDKVGTQPLRIGANSYSLNGYFVGEVDEVRVWNRAVSSSEISAQYNSRTFDTTGQIVHLPFSSASTNVPPTANAGPDQTVNEGDTVTLDGSGSSDSDGTIASYSWTQTAGPSVTLSNTNVAQPTFTAPQVTQDTTFTFSLVVTDDSGESSTADTVNILVQDVSAANVPPTANAGPDQTVNEGDTVTLDGSASSDPDGDALTYSWTQTAGTTSVTLSDASSPTPSFTTPDVDDPDGDTLTFELTVDDGNGHTATDTVNISVQNVIANQPPIASAGHDQTVNEGDTVTLDGSGSSDSDGTIASYSWTQTAGPSVTLSNTNVAQPTFTAPQVTQDTTLGFELVVTDNEDTNSGPATVQIFVRDVREPPPPPPTDRPTTLTLSSISNVPWGETVTVSGRLTDADGGIAGQEIILDGTAIEQQSISANTQSDGTFIVTFAGPNTVDSAWKVQAHYAGDGSTLQPSDSEERTFATLKHDTTLTLVLDPAEVTRGGSYAVHGVLEDSVTNEGIGSMTIAFIADRPLNIKSTTTDSSGSYQVTGLKAPNKSGSHNVEARFAGNSLYGSAASETKTLIVR